MPYSPAASAFPTSLDTFTNPTDSDDTSTFDHSGLETTQNDAIEALQAKVGINSSAVTTSLDYLVKSTSSSNPGHKHTLANGATDVTSSASELNILDGATLSTTELNYVDGVTSAIQTQLDAKVPSSYLDTDGTLAANSDSKIATQKATKTYIDTNGSLITTAKYAPQGFLLNGKLSVSVASNNITVAIKGMDGNDPSSTNKVYCRIGDTVRTLTAALSVTKNAGTNWFNSGSSELATNEIDYFVYLGYNATDGVVIGFARIPNATKYGDFSTTSTNEKYCAISTITTAASTDYYEVVGRFAATLSASASYNWSVPTFTAINLINRPIFETRVLTWTPTWTGFSSDPTSTNQYKINMDKITLDIIHGYQGTSNATTLTVTVPFAAATSFYFLTLKSNSGSFATGSAQLSSSTITGWNATDLGSSWTNTGNKSMFFQGLTYTI